MKRNMKRLILVSVLIVMSLAASQASAVLVAVSGPNSSAGTAPAIIPAPIDILEDFVTNTGMQGFDEALGVVTTVAHKIDGGGVIPAGTLVDSHMIFLNTPDSGLTTHFQVDWTFSQPILGVMSDQGGNLEAASTFELGAPGTNYTVTFPCSGAAAPYGARGHEAQGGGGGVIDGYVMLSPYTLRVDMRVSEPGDWIRVVTLAPLEVDIDIKPGSYPNPINPGSNGVVPVAIFSSPEFDATQVDPTSVELGGAGVAVRGKGKPMAHVEDVDGDGLLDLLVQVETENFAELGEGGIVALTGTTFGGQDIVGYDDIIVVPPEQ